VAQDLEATGSGRGSPQVVLETGQGMETRVDRANGESATGLKRQGRNSDPTTVDWQQTDLCGRVKARFEILTSHRQGGADEPGNRIAKRTGGPAKNGKGVTWSWTTWGNGDGQGELGQPCEPETSTTSRRRPSTGSG
jgi:hypothetical protein